MTSNQLINRYERENKDLKEEIKRLNILLDSVETNMNKYIQNRETVLNIPKSIEIKTKSMFQKNN